MNIVRYIFVFLATGHSALSIFAIGWTTAPASFMVNFIWVAVLTSVAGIVAAIPKKAEKNVVIVAAAMVPALISVIMTQGIIASGAFREIHWLTLVLSSAVFPVISFSIFRKCRTK